MRNGQSNEKGKYWCFTLNNPEEKERRELESWIKDEKKPISTYIVFGREVGDSGTYHLQGYVEFRNRQRLSGCKKLSSRAHWERRRGTGTEAVTYCKKDGDVFEEGTASGVTPGQRTDLETIRGRIIEGCEEKTIADEYFSTWCLHRKAFREYRALSFPPTLAPDLRVVVLWGESGAGKSSYVVNKHTSLYITSDPVLQWFDGYDGQEAILIDDFTGQCPYRWLLRLLDIYPVRLPVKGGHTNRRCKYIYITSNTEIGTWYNGEKDVTPIRRRVKKNIYVSMNDGDTVEERWAYIEKEVE